MSVAETIMDRRISLILSKCKNIIDSTKLVRTYNSTILIPNIIRLNKYITIKENN